MELNIYYIPHEADVWTITRAVASVLHSEDFAPVLPGRLTNFRVKLNENAASTVRNNGTGVLTLPTDDIARKFMNFVYQDPLKIDGKTIRFKKGRPAPEHVALTLRKTPYINPDIEEERLKKVSKLVKKFRIDAVQFGIFYQATYPNGGNKQRSSRAFSIEWERNYSQESFGTLTFEYDHKLIRILLGNELTEREGHSIAVNFASVQKVGIGYDGKPYVCFDTLTPPVLEKIQFHRTLTGKSSVDNRKYKQRIGALHEGHAIVAPYTPHLRLLLYNDPETDVINEFASMCEVAGLSKSMIIKLDGKVQIEALKNQFFERKRMFALHKSLSKFEWPVAFQLESLLHNGLLHTGDIDRLIDQVRNRLAGQSKLPKEQRSLSVADLLRRFNEALQVRPAGESPQACFERVSQKFDFSMPREAFRCYHVTFTPTRMILEGPYASQSNRVIREFKGFEDRFIRVDFRDEDRLQYRWDREVDGTSFLVERVGGTLKNGFELAGRKFEFLAYSSSALREHAVWFMNPFRHPIRGEVNAKSIRDSLGNFAGTPLLKQPSKYAARLAQAFTATDPSVVIPRDEWEEIEDIGKEPYLFTDGVGTISRALADKIWAKLREKKSYVGNTIRPSAFQIRFLGYKGVVAVDEQLDKGPGNIQMRLRPSMRKFDVENDENAPLEIAQAFELPNTCYLNRPLVMVLEDLGVRKEAFQDLQDAAVADAKTIDDSLSKFCEVMASHHLGTVYRLREILTRLQRLFNMDLTSSGKTIGIDTPFLRLLRQVAMTDILRDIKHSARIPVPDSYLLVGVADEGPWYESKGFKNVYTLPYDEIFVCIQERGKDPIWIEGNVSISRSPVAHPGDVQRVRAIGKPPENMLCLFAHLRNVVVLPSKGGPDGKERSLASCLAGGDVDGDLFSVICHDAILPRTIESPASYEPLPTLTLDRDSTVDDICDFVVEYINSDILGLLSDRLLVIADQSIDGIRDLNCIYLAELCSHAVDYPKQGTPPNLDTNQLPRTLIRCKPDWHAAEVVSPRETDYYESSRALGFMFRAIKLDDLEPIALEEAPSKALSDPISLALKDSVRKYLGDSIFFGEHPTEVLKLFRRYADELRYISATHTLSNTPGVRLLEAEIVVGTILAKCSQKRWRKDRIYRMRLHGDNLVRDIQRSLLENPEEPSYEGLCRGLELAWSAWDLSLRQPNDFGAHSFGLIALGIIFDCLDGLDTLGAR